jgi:hypothetical protein
VLREVTLHLNTISVFYVLVARSPDRLVLLSALSVTREPSPPIVDQRDVPPVRLAVMHLRRGHRCVPSAQQELIGRRRCPALPAVPALILLLEQLLVQLVHLAGIIRNRHRPVALCARPDTIHLRAQVAKHVLAVSGRQRDPPHVHSAPPVILVPMRDRDRAAHVLLVHTQLLDRLRAASALLDHTRAQRPQHALLARLDLTLRPVQVHAHLVALDITLGMEPRSALNVSRDISVV